MIRTLPGKLFLTALASAIVALVVAGLLAAAELPEQIPLTTAVGIGLTALAIVLVLAAVMTWVASLPHR